MEVSHQTLVVAEGDVGHVLGHAVDVAHAHRRHRLRLSGQQRMSDGDIVRGKVPQHVVSDWNSPRFTRTESK
jgi:hypothetical protein